MLVTRVFEELYNSQSEIVVNVGGAGSSKSYSTAQYLLTKFNNEKNVKILICRKTLPSLRITAYKLFVDLLREYGRYAICQHNRSERTIMLPANNNLVYFTSIDDPEKIKSTDWNYIWIEEAIELDYNDFLILWTRLRSKEVVGGRNQMILTLNPSDEFSWIKEKLMIMPEVEIITSTYHDNPFLSDQYRKILEGLAEQDEQFYKIYALGQWASSPNKIYTNWQLTKSMPNTEPIYGVDFGFNSPTALIEIRLQGNVLYEKQLLYESGLTNQQLIDKLRLLIPNKNNYIYCDTEDPGAIDAIYKSGFNAHPADKNVFAGIKYVKQFKEMLLKDSVDLIAEQQAYSWKMDKNGRTLDEPVKFRDHLMDAKRYAVYTHGRKFWQACDLVIPKINLSRRQSITTGF
jgi:phage terminase large subunit